MEKIMESVYWIKGYRLLLGGFGLVDFIVEKFNILG